ncbi:MAG: putative asparagine synthetase [glutamine-hydrolyzing] [Phycisphaerae bacterium]|nr:MAG: putative asparagine synthetase [glutamine-hydrolyzing] [Phycisphaerae bacterium]
MCGILGLISPAGHRVPFTREEIVRAREALAHRGPDDDGLWDGGRVVFAHRRLIVVDPTAGGHQPWEHARGVLVYNGELYNDAELRAALSREGWAFRTRSDTETVLAALATWGPAGLDRLRGMYALVYFDARTGETLLARDPLGIKPLYWTAFERDGVPHVAFASEIPGLLALPGVGHAPDLATVSAYLTTIRTTLGARTLFRNIRTVLPGQVMRVDAGARAHAGAAEWRIAAMRGGAPDEARVREVVDGSVRAHLRADVPTCALLSGGLDSSIVCMLVRRALPNLFTYAAGAATDAADDDLSWARRVAGEIGSVHVEAPVSRELFLERWPAMIRAMGVPLSTPNEVAINAVARRLRADGKTVTLSGEGADELFGGYEHPLRQAAAYEAARAAGADARHGGEFQLDDAAWVPRHAKAAVLNEDVWRGVEQDGVLVEEYRRVFEECRAAGADDVLDPHLRFQRRVNLIGLLQRLDTATMLEGVEGRTPFADVEVARLAEALPMVSKFDPATSGVGGTKIALRRAFAGDVPRGVIERPKASFPLPFRDWLPGASSWLRESKFAREVFTEAAVETVAARAEELWQLAWPMLNIAMWGRRFV